jgi:bacteriocin-type transport-associated protein
MTEVLLKELSNSDIDWMIATGRQEEITAGAVLTQAGRPIDSLYIVLDGTLTIAVSQPETDPLALAFSALEGRQTSQREFARLSRGEIVGEVCLLNERPSSTTVKAIERSLVLSIPQQQLAKKLQQDVSFASHFYRAIAILLSDRLQYVVNQFGNSRFAQASPLREILLVFGELSDSDIDWMIATGHREQIPSGTVLIYAGRPVDGLYILLNGTMTVSVAEEVRNPLALVFAGLEGGEISGREISRLSRGNIIGEMPFVDDRLPDSNVKAFEDSLVLMIPRQQLAVKLQQDVVFASHFYRVIAILLSNRLQDIAGRLGYGRRVYHEGQALAQDIVYEDEIDLNVMDHVDLARARFDWMLKRLRTRIA